MTPLATVYLVGAGPGDAGLLTVRGAELLARAEVVLTGGSAGGMATFLNADDVHF